MSEAEAPPEQAATPTAPKPRVGCLGKVLIAIGVLVALFFAIGLAFDQGEDANQPQRGFNAGTAELYARSDITYAPGEHVYVVRLADGSFIALYDYSPKQQELDSDCRVTFDERANLGALDQLAGVRGALVEVCEGARAVWRIDGVLASGAGDRDLDRFSTSIDENGDLIVDTRSRTCTRSKGVPGIPPYVKTTCRGAG